jgi:endonuclease YncB( thermonuclease family)
MGFTLIKGTFQLEAGIPDGDSVRFMADDDLLFDQLAGRPVEFRTDGTVMLRYEGIDAIEKTAIQPFASLAKEANFDFLREQSDPHASSPRGFILSRQTDANRRPVSFAFAGEAVQEDGSDIFLDAALLQHSVNHKLVAAGHAYTMFYETLFAELRAELTAAYVSARQQSLGIHRSDASLGGVTFAGRPSLSEMPPIFPKLWRRLEEYSRNHQDLGGFLLFLQTRVVDRLFTVSDGRYIAFDNVITVAGDQLRMEYEPFDMVFRPA